MGFNPRDMQKLQQQMLRAQEQMAKAQEEMAQNLAKLVIEGSAGGGAVVITISGDQHPLSIKIDRDAVDPEDVATLEDLILAALTDALEKSMRAQEAAQQKVVNAATGGMKLPPGLGF